MDDDRIVFIEHRRKCNVKKQVWTTSIYADNYSIDYIFIDPCIRVRYELVYIHYNGFILDLLLCNDNLLK